jgi:dUTP pyrophosphatase
VSVKIKLIHPKLGKEWKLPSYATSGSVGMDLVAAIDAPTWIVPGGRVLVPAGFSMQLEQGFEAQIRPRSGLALKHGVTVLNSPGTIDSDYTGEVGIVLINHGVNAFDINPGDRIAQMVINRVELVELDVVGELEATTRSAGGFGSTGK